MLKVCEDCMYRKTCGNNKTDASKCLHYIPSESMKQYLRGYVDGFACGEQAMRKVLNERMTKYVLMGKEPEEEE